MNSVATTFRCPADPTITVWRYIIRGINGEGWGYLLLASDGYFSAVSDYGNYAFRWTAIGEGRDFRDFLAHIGTDYLISKIAPEKRYDGGLTEKHVRQLIDEQVASGLLAEQDKKRELDLLRQQSGLENEFHFYEWMNRTDLVFEYQDIFETSHNGDAFNFCNKLFPRFAAVLRAELAGP